VTLHIFFNSSALTTNVIPDFIIIRLKLTKKQSYKMMDDKLTAWQI